MKTTLLSALSAVALMAAPAVAQTSNNDLVKPEVMIGGPSAGAAAMPMQGAAGHGMAGQGMAGHSMAGSGMSGHSMSGQGMTGASQQPMAAGSGAMAGQAGAGMASGMAAPMAATMTQDQMMMVEQAFVADAAAGSVGEITLSQMALQKSQNPQVRQFAQQMIADHRPMLAEMGVTAQSQGLTVPNQIDPGRMHHSMMLSQMTGADFDRRYIQVSVMEHMKAADLLQSHAMHSQNPANKALAAKNLPLVQQHLAMAQQLMQQMAVASR
ncbi:MAG TPA: DUF4142 domain-containing protein [Alphaproteobacteria bacterium]|nr:DUF4142 domain-containing protein [Alphaproteobacteria bacterium]